MTEQQMEGAAREAVVKADLLRRGFEVFQTVCTNSTFDLVAYKHCFLLRVEVKGKHRAPRGNMPIASTKGKGNADCRKFDLLAGVDGKEVRYVRSVLHKFNAVSKELVGEEIEDPNTRKDIIARRIKLEGQC